MASLLSALVIRKVSSSTITSVVLALYAEALVKLVKARPKDLQSKGPRLLLEETLPASVRNRIVEQFTENKY